MIKLFYALGTCALAIHIALEWIGEPYELQQVKRLSWIDGGNVAMAEFSPSLNFNIL